MQTLQDPIYPNLRHYPPESRAEAAFNALRQMKNRDKTLFPDVLKQFISRISKLGLKPDLPAYTYRKSYAFNQMNFAGLLGAIIRLIYIAGFSAFPVRIMLVNALPALGCLLMMFFMLRQAHKTTVFFSFLVFPGILFFIGLTTQDRGIVAYFVPYFIYPFFFLNSIRKIIFSFTLSMLFFGATVLSIFGQPAGTIIFHDGVLEGLSLIGALCLTFITLFTIKVQVWHYEKKIRKQKHELEDMNGDILRQKEKLHQSNLTKDKLFSIISHDLRIPINGLLLLLSNYEDPEEGIQYIAENLPLLREELHITNELLNNLLKWSQLQMSDGKLSVEKVDLPALGEKIKRSIGQRAGEKGISVELNFPPGPDLYADKGVLEVVLRNLVINSIKFTNKGGLVLIRGEQEGNIFVIQVCDNGVGMNKVSLAKIEGREFFTSPGTAHEKGTGMGLILCRDLVGQCKGELTIESMAGTGTTVSVSLPLGQEERLNLRPVGSPW